MGVSLTVFDTTLRDGQLGKGIDFSAEKRMHMATALQEAGVPVLEIAYPAKHPQDIASSQQIARQLRHVSLCCIAGMQQGQIDAAMQVLQYAAHPRLHLYLEAKYNKWDLTRAATEADAMGKMIARQTKRMAQVEFSLMDVGHMETDILLFWVRMAVQAGASCINLSDTPGSARVEQLVPMLTRVADELSHLNPSVSLSLHAHNHEGRAVENAVAAVQHGVTQIEGTLGGIGPAGGNLDLIACLQSLEQQLPDVSHGVDVEKLMNILTTTGS